MVHTEQRFDMTLLTMSMAPPNVDICPPEFCCNRPVRNSIFIVPEGVYIRIEQYTYWHISLSGANQSIDDVTIGQVERCQVKALTRLCIFN